MANSKDKDNEKGSSTTNPTQKEPVKINVLHIQAPGKKTKNKAFLKYKEQEDEKTNRVCLALEQSKNKFLDFRSLYPELQLSSKIIGIFAPWSAYPHKMPDFFPFYETIFCYVKLSSCSSDAEFKSLYGCTYKDFLRLVDMGKIIPLVEASPQMKNSNFDFFKGLLERNPPSSLRYAKILQNDYLLASISHRDIIDIHTKAIKYLLKTLGSLVDRFNIKEPLATKLAIPALKPAQRGDLALSSIYLGYIYFWLESNPDKIEQLIPNLLVLEGWNEQPYLAPSTTLNYSSIIMDSLKQHNKGRDIHLKSVLQAIPGANEDAVNKFIAFTDTAPSLSAENLAILKESYFYEPPEFYGDPVKYAYHLSKSDNIKEQFRIAQAFQLEVEGGRFSEAQEIRTKAKYQELINEINREIQLLEKVSRFGKVSLEFGASIIGVATGALIGSQLGQREITLLFSFLGANAASVLMKDYSKPISQRVIVPLFKKSNTSLLLWKSLEKKR